MAIRYGRGTVQRILDSSDGFALQVQAPSDLGAAIGALKLARVDLLGLAAGRSVAGKVAGARPAGQVTVSPVVRAPGGPMVLVERLEAEYDVLRSVPEVVSNRLEQAGVESATIEVPEPGGPLDALDTAPHAVVLRVFPVAGASAIPADWIDVACEWVTGDLEDDDAVRLRILTVEFDVPARQASAVMHECGLARSWCDAVNGELSDRIRTASLTYGRLPHLALAAGGPAVDSTGLFARFALLRDIARELAADLAYACIDFEPTFEGLALGLSPDGWERAGGASPNAVARDLINDRVPDAYPYQVLSPGHLARLDANEVPLDLLGDGRAELSIDDTRAWLPHSLDRDDAREQGWELLKPLLVTAKELADQNAGKPPSAPPVDEPAVGDAPATLTSAMPELEAVVLEAAPHSRRGARLTVLELVSWLDREDHTDWPSSVSPVLATYARWLGAGLGDQDRQSLKAIAPRLVNTKTDNVAAERARSWLATEWLVKVQAPAWLRAAGMLEAADRLAALGSLNDDMELVRAVELLGSAVTIASRRIDITASIVEDDEQAGRSDDERAWSAWERVTESTGWVAASEAATHGAPVELIYATDQRVIECSRDPRTRRELETSRQSIGDSAWSTALHAIADEAWDQGWRAADIAARELSGFTIRVEMGRVAKTVEGAADIEFSEIGLELAERAARDSLTKAALRGGTADGSEAHPWDEANAAAVASEGGEAWSIVTDEARKAVGADGWAQGMADAREVVGALLAIAPDTVARVVVASVAREASGAAARGLAFRAATVARAQGGDDSAAADAAAKSLETVAATLRAASYTLLGSLISPP